MERQEKTHALDGAEQLPLDVPMEQDASDQETQTQDDLQ